MGFVLGGLFIGLSELESDKILIAFLGGLLGFVLSSGKDEFNAQKKKDAILDEFGDLEISAQKSLALLKNFHVKEHPLIPDELSLPIYKHSFSSVAWKFSSEQRRLMSKIISKVNHINYLSNRARDSDRDANSDPIVDLYNCFSHLYIVEKACRQLIDGEKDGVSHSDIPKEKRDEWFRWYENHKTNLKKYREEKQSSTPK